MNQVARKSMDQSHFHLIVWGWLVLLLIAGLAVFVLPIPKSAAVLLIFAIAAIKAGLVLRNFMHLTHEHILIYLIAFVPMILFLAFALSLIPDIVYRHGLGK